MIVLEKRVRSQGCKHVHDRFASWLKHEVLNSLSEHQKSATFIDNCPGAIASPPPRGYLLPRSKPDVHEHDNVHVDEIQILWTDIS